MISKLFIVILLQIYSVDSEVRNDSFDKSSRGLQLSLFNSNSVVYGLANKAADIDFDSARCKEELLLIEAGIREKEDWVVKLIDASAKEASGFYYGNNFWLGSRDQCNNMMKDISPLISDRYERTMKTNLMQTVPPFEVELKMAYVSHKSPMQIDLKIMLEHVLHLGLCLPKSCGTHDVWTLLQATLDDVDTRDEHKLQPRVLDVKDLKLNPKFFRKTSLWLLVTFAASVYFLTRAASRLKRKVKIDENQNVIEEVESEQKLSFFEEVTKCFNSEDNKKFIRSRESSTSSVNSISGLRSIACLLIAISHICTFLHFTLANKVSYIDQTETFLGLVLLNAALLVDGFFTISGYLATTNLLRDTARVAAIKSNTFAQNAKLYGKLLAHRYIRLTPLYILAMLSSDITSSLLNDISVYKLNNREDLMCSRYWWRHIIYIQNLFPDHEMCVGWSWSIACEMQFFVIVTFVLMLYIRNQKLGVNLLKASLVGITIFSFFVHMNHKFSIKFDVMVNLLSAVYLVPWTRIGPYIVGTLAAIYLNKSGGKLEVSQKLQHRLCLICCLIFAVVMLGQLYKSASTPVASLMKVAAHLEVAFVFSWIIIAEISGYRNRFIKFLSGSFFIRYSKTTYAMYLFSPIVAILTYGLSRNGLSYDFPEIIIMSNVILKLSSKVAFLATAYFEVPFCNLSRLVLHKIPSKEKMK